MKRRLEPSAVVRAVGYARVSTEEQAESGAGILAQVAVIEGEVERRGWDLVRMDVENAVSGKRMSNRPGLAGALASLTDGHADVLVVAKLDRLSRSMLDFCLLLDRARREGWSLVILDLGIDLTTASGEVMAHVAAAFAQFERRLISDRTRAALAEKRKAGVRLGRPSILTANVVARIAAARGAGQTLAAIADSLNAEGVPTAHNGAQWHPSTVAAVLRSAKLREAA
ncbi:MAG: recombinase family protein [Candidatus Dormibacteria bacterium]